MLLILNTSVANQDACSPAVKRQVPKNIHEASAEVAE